ncbi:MAG: response regulator transcription factor [Acidobacteriota bacterium]|nr:response regulator transcription factor [Acidobacteriota bacterium]MDE3169055.1 response regulator transcription factor [Acidobacteriota bacterium]
MKRGPAFPGQSQIKARETSKPSSLIFCERATGVAQFGAASDANLEFTVERAAGLLAMQCMARGAEPADFAILVPVERLISQRLIARAQELLSQGRSASSSTHLSPRQQQILQSVICNRENKEIASRLNITVRTVKFHISALLSKFGVENRTELARRAASMMHSPILAQEEKSRARELRSVPMPGEAVNSGKSSIRFPGRAMSA